MSKEIIDYIFEKIQDFWNKNKKEIGDIFGHELALALKDVIDKGTLVVDGNMRITDD